MENCKYSDDIPKLMEKVSKIEKALYDNGQKGLISTPSTSRGKSLRSGGKTQLWNGKRQVISF